MENSSQYSQPIIKIVSASDVTDEARKEKREDAIEKLFLTGIAGTSTLLAAKVFKDSLAASSIIDSLNTKTLDASIGGITNRHSDITSFRDLKGGPITLSDAGLSVARNIEELSPFKILRTFNLSHVMFPFTSGGSVDYTFTGDHVNAMASYVDKVLASENKQLTGDHRRFGLKLRQGSLYEIDADGNERVLLQHAKLAATHFDIRKESAGDHRISYKNKVLEKYANIKGVRDSGYFEELKARKLDQFTFIGSDSSIKLGADYGARSYGRVAFERGAKVFDKPFAEMVEWLPDSKLADKLGNAFTLNMGTGGDYTQSVPRSLAMMAGNITKKTLLLGAGFYALDALASNVAPEDSAYSKGIVPGISTSVVNTHIGYAEAVSDKFQDYKEKQEYLAPGSTELMTLAGFPLMGAMHGGMASYFTRVGQTTAKGIEYAEKQQGALKAPLSFISEDNKILGKLGKATTRSRRWAIRGAVAGALAALPFAPGALIGESSEELKAVYSGEKDVAIRANRWWFSGGTEYDGQKIKYFTKGWYARMMSEGETKSLYGDKETKDAMNPFLHPLDYFRDPYKFEKMHEEDRPYAVWGMDVSFASFFGKAFEKTVGQIIKPDVINPKLAGYLTSEAPEGVQINNPVANISGLPNNRLAAGASDLINNAMETKTYDFTVPVSDKDASLIADGMMLPPPSAQYNPLEEGASWSWGAAKDFLGLKGWALGLMQDDMDMDGVLPPQLSRSGEATNAGRAFRDLNLGGAFGLTESQRRFLPTSSGSIYERVNPLKNTMPSWLPGDDSNYYMNFSTGDPFTKLENGIFRLPGVGYEAIHEELEGVSAEEYPDIFKLKILSDVALGSDSYYQVKNRIEDREKSDRLTNHEAGMLATIRDQERQRGQTKRFSEYKTDAQLENVSTVGKALNAYWEGVTHNSETPAEFLTFFRPASKLIHQRTAVEDYAKTQLYGSDLALWTKPADQFIEPAIDTVISKLDDEYIPEDVVEKRGINEYFDKLEYVKQRKLYSEATEAGDYKQARTHKSAYEKTIHGTLTSNIDTEKELLRSYIALPSEEKAYFASFVNAKAEDRDEIAGMLSDDISAIYQTIWNRKDIADNAAANGEDVNAALRQQAQLEDDILKESNPEDLAEYNSKETKGTFKEHLADKQAEAFISETTGMPDEDFVGWDPRIDLEDVKLRTLEVGNEDMHDFGFWKSDKERLSRMVAVLEEEQVVNQIQKMKDSLKEKHSLKENIAQMLYEKGFDVSDVEIYTDQESGITLNVEI